MEDTITIVEYDQSWAEAFESEKEALLSGLGAEAAAIEHVGSTAIPGQASKPVIDIFVGLTPLRPVAYYESRFDPASYTHIPTGMQGRYLFAKRTEGKWTHNVHLMMYDALFHTRNEILLRDYLRIHPELVTQYGAEKKGGCPKRKFHGSLYEGENRFYSDGCGCGPKRAGPSAAECVGRLRLKTARPALSRYTLVA
ncbi:GrpB family protein [Paenibacillus sp. Dod16]|uniref:GrpB family protein n=1 Tax=Paenibacillus sp. Dod16 TaxID=3416392 RepID=UPI003CF79C5D